MLPCAGSWATSSMSPGLRSERALRPAAVPSSEPRSGVRISVLAAQTHRRISSRQTFFLKRVFPVLWFGMVVLSLVAGLAGARAGQAAPPPVFIVPRLLALLGYGVLP